MILQPVTSMRLEKIPPGNIEKTALKKMAPERDVGARQFIDHFPSVTN